jgi:hypothetical protein
MLAFQRKSNGICSAIADVCYKAQTNVPDVSFLNNAPLSSPKASQKCAETADFCIGVL